MLSDTLRSLARHFDGWSKLGGVHLDAPACTILAGVLASSGDDAAQIEALPVPAELRSGDNVVALDAARAARRTRAAAGDWGAA